MDPDINWKYARHNNHINDANNFGVLDPSIRDKYRYSIHYDILGLPAMQQRESNQYGMKCTNLSM
jgi:hypothetical protein